MTFLLDTHAFLWFCQNDPSLSATAKALIEDPGNQTLLSLVSCWEIAIKAGVGKLTLGEPAATYIPNALARTGINILPLSLAHVTAVESLAQYHRDPFDRALVAQAQVENLAIVSADVVFDTYGIRRMW